MTSENEECRPGDEAAPVEPENHRKRTSPPREHAGWLRVLTAKVKRSINDGKMPNCGHRKAGRRDGVIIGIVTGEEGEPAMRCMACAAEAQTHRLSLDQRVCDGCGGEPHTFVLIGPWDRQPILLDLTLCIGCIRQEGWA